MMEIFNLVLENSLLNRKKENSIVIDNQFLNLENPKILYHILIYLKEKLYLNYIKPEEILRIFVEKMIKYLKFT